MPGDSNISSKCAFHIDTYKYLKMKLKGRKTFLKTGKNYLQLKISKTARNFNKLTSSKCLMKLYLYNLYIISISIMHAYLPRHMHTQISVLFNSIFINFNILLNYYFRNVFFKIMKKKTLVKHLSQSRV